MSHHLTYCLDSDAETNPSKKRLPEECARPARPAAPEHTTPPPKPRNTQTRSSRSARGSSESTNNIIADADSEDAAHEVVAYDRAQKKYRDKLDLWKYEATIWKEDQAKIERITKERVKWTSDREVCYVALYKFLSVPYQHEVDQSKQGLTADELQQFDYTALLGFAKVHYAQGKGLDRFNSVLHLMDFAPARGETHETFLQRFQQSANHVFASVERGGFGESIPTKVLALCVLILRLGERTPFQQLLKQLSNHKLDSAETYAAVIRDIKQDSLIVKNQIVVIGTATGRVERFKSEYGPLKYAKKRPQAKDPKRD